MFIVSGYANHESNHKSENWVPYLSPGIQIGLNFNGKLFVSIQTTIGLFKGDFVNYIDMYPIGMTIGKRFYYDKKKWHIYNFLDTQVSFGVVGIGIGKIYNSFENYNKFKTWIGFYGLGTYDYVNWDRNKHNIGIFGVLPLMYDDSCECIKID